MKVHLPWLNKANGSSAGLIYQSYWGMIVTRTFPWIFHYPDTDKQKKAQADFYDIAGEWAKVYKELSPYIHHTQRRGCNVSNMLSRSIYAIYRPLFTNTPAPHLRSFGVDTRPRVRLSFDVLEFTASREIFTFEFHVSSIEARIEFHPTTVHLFVVNTDRVLMQYEIGEFDDSLIVGSIEFKTYWTPGNTVLLYVALSASNFLSNFQLCATTTVSNS